MVAITFYIVVLLNSIIDMTILFICLINLKQSIKKKLQHNNLFKKKRFLVSCFIGN